MRTAYTIYNLVSDLTGQLIFLIYMIECLLKPLSRFSYQISALNKLYLVRTTDKQIFKMSQSNQNMDDKKMKLPSEFEHTKVASEVAFHYPVSLGLQNFVYLYILRSCCCSCFRNKNNKTRKNLSTKDKLNKLYEEGQKKFAKELSIERILKQLRNLRI